MLSSIRQQLFSAVEVWLGSYITIHRRPLRAATFNRTSAPTKKLPPYAVILRGILVPKSDFTVETVLIYKKIFPGAPLIISTLDNAPADLLQKLRVIPDVYITLTQKTNPHGYGHINDQIDCSVAGLTKAKELGAEFVVHTRTDQRINATDIYPYLLGLTEAFPIASGTLQHKRIVALGFSTIKYRTYSLNDMFFFGTTKDLLLYWDLPHDTRDIPKLYAVKDWITNRVCEGYLFTSFLNKVGHNTRDTLGDYWEALGKYFVLVDAADLDFYWIKYLRYYEYRDRQYAGYTLGEHVGFKDWISMYKGYQDPNRIPKDFENLFNDTHHTNIELI